VNFIQLCEEVGEWSMKNFGEQSPENPAEGFIEELGEFCHAHLKMKQGIRGTQEEHQAAMADAIGDATIYLADFCYRAGFLEILKRNDFLLQENFPSYFDKDDEGSSIVNFIYKTVSAIGSLLENWLDGFYTNDHIGIALGYLYFVCMRNNLNLNECVVTTWTQVKQRNWKQNKLTGVAE